MLIETRCPLRHKGSLQKQAKYIEGVYGRRLCFRFRRARRIAYRRDNVFCGDLDYAASAGQYPAAATGKNKRQDLYRQFIESASNLYVDSLLRDRPELPPLVSLCALVNEIRVVSGPGVAHRADKVVRMIVNTYLLPNKTLPELHEMVEKDALDPLREFSDACHQEVHALT